MLTLYLCCYLSVIVIAKHNSPPPKHNPPGPPPPKHNPKGPPPFVFNLNFDHIERDNNVACYYYQIQGHNLNKWEKVTIYTNPDDDADEVYTSITNLLYQQCDIRPRIFEYQVVISEQYGAGIAISKKKHEHPHVYRDNQIFFCIDDVIDHQHDAGAYCIHTKSHNPSRKSHDPSCDVGLSVPDFVLATTTSEPSAEPTTIPTAIPTSEPTIEIEGEVLIPGETYSFPDGSFTLADNAVVIRPYMIHDCSLDSEYVHLYVDQLNDLQIDIGNPLISLMVDIYDMPLSCPVLFGTIDSITQISTNIIEIELDDLALTHLFTHADFDISDMPVIDLGYSMLPNDSFVDDDDDDTDVYIINNGSYFINDTDLFNNATSLRRRLWGFDISPQIIFPSISLTIPVNSYFTVELKYETRFKLHIILDVSWWKVQRFKIEWSRTAEASFTLTASLKAEFEKEFTFLTLKGKTFVVNIWGIPVLITPFQKYNVGFSATAELKSECKLSVSLTNKRGFDYTRGRGLKLIWSWKPSFDASCDLLEGRKCELSFRVWIAVIRGIKIYKGIITAALEQRYGPKLTFTYPTDTCKCSSKSSEISLSWVKEKFFSITLADHWLFEKLLGIKPKKWKTPSLTKTSTISLGICIDLPALIEAVIHWICCPSPTSPPTKSPLGPTTALPTYAPYKDPTFDPTTPTSIPTKSPILPPTITVNTTYDPTSDPTFDPTSDPTSIPTPHTSSKTTYDPTNDPTRDPTSDPSLDPTSDPTLDPTLDPTMDPTSDPTSNPLPGNAAHVPYLLEIEREMKVVADDDERTKYWWIEFTVCVTLSGCILVV
eukprot:330458_1